MDAESILRAAIGQVGRDTTATHSDRQRPSEAPTGAVPVDPVGPESPYYVKEWRGRHLYGCPGCDFVAWTHAGVDRHRAVVHAPPPVLSAEERARRAGIIISKG